MIEMDSSIIRHMAGKDKRLDNRGLEQYRKIEIEKSIISSAEGSARVRLGKTEVIAGIKIETGEPFPDTPDEGVLIVSTELVPLASPDFESGPPNEESIEISRVVDRAIRESKAIDFKQLCITEGEKVWMLNVDIDVLNDDGNLIDASCIAAVAALTEAKMPELDAEGKKDKEKKKTKTLPMSGTPVSTTFIKINDKILADPSLIELKAMDARLTVGTIDTASGIRFCSMQKGGSYGFGAEDIEAMLELAEKKGSEIRKMIKK